MTSAEALLRWLSCPDKSFHENLQFAIKAWKSIELTQASKYEIIFKWLADALPDQTFNETHTAEELVAFFNLSVQPGLISNETKLKFLRTLLSLISNAALDLKYKFVEILCGALGCEAFQDIFRANYHIVTETYGALFKAYSQYLKNLNLIDDTNQINTEFFLKALGSLIAYIKLVQNLEKFEKMFYAYVLVPLVDSIMELQKHDICFFNKLIELQQLLIETKSNQDILKNISKLPLHAHMLALECALVHRRGDQEFIQLVLNEMFINIESQKDDPKDRLVICAYILHIFHKHQITLLFEIGEETAVSFIGKHLMDYVRINKEQNFRETLLLLCATLTYNPRLLQEGIYQITTWMLFGVKSNDMEQKLYEYYLLFLIGMFDRMNHTERFVINLLNVIREWLAKYELPTIDFDKIQVSRSCSTAILDQIENDNSCDAIIISLYKAIKRDISKYYFMNKKEENYFPYLESTWPNYPVGIALIKLFSNLMIKPANVIWKSLLFGIDEILQRAKNEQILSNNTIFNLDLHAAFLCQFFQGVQIVELAEKIPSEHALQRKHTITTLNTFRELLLARKHNSRTMNAFINCSIFFTIFEISLANYMTDDTDESELTSIVVLKDIQSHLNASEWTQIEQRVLESRCHICRDSMLRLAVHYRIVIALLLQKEENVSQDNFTLFKQLESIYTDNLRSIYNGRYIMSQSLGFGTNMQTQLKNYLKPFLSVSSLLNEAFKNSDEKKSLMLALPFDFDLKTAVFDDPVAVEALLESVASTIKAHVCNSNQECKKSISLDAEQSILNILNDTSEPHLRSTNVATIFMLAAALYYDACQINATNIKKSILKYIAGLLHFGENFNVCKYFTTQTLFHIFQTPDCSDIYNYIFTYCIKSSNKSTECFLTELVDILKNKYTSEKKLNNGEISILVCGIESLSKVSGPLAKHMRRFLERYLDLFGNFIHGVFNDDTANKEALVASTVSAYSIYLISLLTNLKTNQNESERNTNDGDSHEKPISDDLKRITKIFIAYSIDCHKMHSLNFITVALSNRQHLDLDQDEIEFVLSSYWRKLNDELKSNDEIINSKFTNGAIKLIISNKTDEDFLLILHNLNKIVVASDPQESELLNALRLLHLIAKSPFSTIKGAILNEQLKLITMHATVSFLKKDLQRPISQKFVLNMLMCQQAVVENKMVPLAYDTMDTILAFTLQIKLNDPAIHDTNHKYFMEVHTLCTDLCIALLKNRNILFMDRVSEFMDVYKLLISSIICYKSDRDDYVISAEEIEQLGERAMKLTTLMDLIVLHRVSVKRVVPFMLVYIINLMAATNRTKTVYKKIKIHIEHICNHLIQICDRHSERFILRCLNDSARQLYEDLVSGYKKYYKFQGRI